MESELTLYPLVVVRWRDASYQRGECTIEEMAPLIQVVTCGLLVQENEDTISVALDYFDHDKTWRYIEHIPKVNVDYIKRVSECC